MKKNCANCDAEFEGHGNRKYCRDKTCQKSRAAKHTAEYKKRNPKRVKANRQRRRNTDEYRAKHNDYEKMRIQRPKVKKKILKRRMELYHEINPKTGLSKGYERQEKLLDKKYGRRPDFDCAFCGKTFTNSTRIIKEDSHNIQKTCSKKCQQNWHQRKRRECPKYRLHSRISCQINQALRKRGLSKKGNRTLDDLGCTKKELMTHFESLFTDGMSWDNMSEWHIDHIRPVSSFDFDSTDHPDFKKCWALNNLQPLWAADNMSKNDKWDGVVNA
tara:strand:- start:20 stop:838 length:819 start_codon:yes stop_codon:yes gene_type:complete